MIDQPKAYSVSAITRMIKDQLEERFQDIWVEGEISGYLHHSSGHRYFTLKDEKAILNGVIWRSAGNYLKFEPENGQKVLAFGSISLYERAGKYQLTCRKVEPVGTGPLEIAFRQLYEKLAAEGLFDDDLKKPIPNYPTRIGIVTSRTGAAIRDIIRIAQRRNSSVELFLFPAQVQGEGAERTIAAGIEYFNSNDSVDLVIIGRGGGSLEDLWAFNTETTVRAVAASKLPIVSAVGHEIDTTLSDLVADLRVATPSAAAEQTVWSKEALQDYVRRNIRAQGFALKNTVESAREELNRIRRRPIYARPFDLVNQYRQHLDSLTRMITTSGKNSFDRLKNRLSLVTGRLETLSPTAILKRGYSVTRLRRTGELLLSYSDVDSGSEIETILAEGRLVSEVKSSTGKESK